MTTWIAGLYYRISDDREGRELGVERQDKDCTELAGREDAEIYDRYCDNDISASEKGRKDRPNYNRIMADAKAGRINMIVAYTSGRLTRRPREHEDLIDLSRDYGITFRYVRSPSFDLNTAQGRRIARTLAAQDAGEAEEIAERVKAAVVQRAEKGEPHGGPRSFGISADCQAIVEDEANMIRAWYAHVLTPGKSLHSLERDLARRGILTPERVVRRRRNVDGKLVIEKVDAGSKPWKASNIGRILTKTRNAGFRLLDGKRYRTPHPAIVEEHIWQAAQEILRGDGRKVEHSTARKHLGTGLFLCARCADRSVNTGYSRRGDLVYKCLGCYRQWRAEPINIFVNDLVEKILTKEDERERWLPRDTSEADALARTLRTEAAAIKTNAKGLAVQCALADEGGITREALQDALEAAERRLAEIAGQLSEMTRRATVVDDLLGAEDPVAKWRSLRDLGQRQRAIAGLMTVRLGEPIRGRAKWEAKRFIEVTPRRAGSRR